ncbi:MAG: MFS transporter [bacterium]|nr:MFS transporter [bacterium]
MSQPQSKAESSRSLSEQAEKWVLVTAILASSMAFIDSSALRTALPRMQLDLNISGGQLVWVENAYTLLLSALILLGGSLGDHYGRKRVFGIGIGIFTAASLLCGLAPTVEVLIAARGLQGIGGALMVPGSLALISALVAPERRGRAIGTWSTFSTATTLFGPALGGFLTDNGLWRGVFFINIPLAAIALYALITYVPENKDPNAPRQLDYIGGLLITLGLAGLTVGFTLAPERGLVDALVLAMLLGGLVFTIAFFINEARSDHPMMPLRLFKSRTFAGTNALTLLLYAALGALPFFVGLNLQQVQGYSATFAGLTMLPLGIMLTLMSRWAGGLVDRVGARLPLTIGPAIAGLGFLMFAFPGLTGGESDYWLTFLPPSLVLGFGMGITVAPLTTAVMGSAPAESAGTASGINNAVARTASVLAIATLGALSLVVFSGNLQSRTADLGLSAETSAALETEASKLAGAEIPEGATPEQAGAIRGAVQWAFIDTFRLVAVICAVLAWGSALLGWLLVEGKTTPVRRAEVAVRTE